MKHEATSMRTKKALAASLKGFMETKPLSRITVSEIIADCGVNRKTFYYHFKDIYDLLKWMLEEEAIEVVKQFDLLLNYPEAIRFTLRYVRENRHLLCCAYDSVGRDEMKRFFFADFVGIVETGIRNTEAQLGLAVTDDFRVFLTHMYTEALAGMLIDAIHENGEPDTEKVVDYLALVLRASLPSVLREGPQAAV